jgi:predicted component of type VI protein secretion system
MSKPSPNPASAIEAELGGADGNVNKIRDILFGSQMRDYERKFTQLEERLMKESADLREDVKRRFASLEAFIKGEVEALDGAQKAEKNERAEEVKELAAESKETAKRLEKRIAQLDEDNSKSQRSLRQLVLDESKRLAEEIGVKHTDVSANIAKELQELRGILTDRHALSDLFAELSLRLKNEFKLPGE